MVALDEGAVLFSASRERANEGRIDIAVAQDGCPPRKSRVAAKKDRRLGEAVEVRQPREATEEFSAVEGRFLCDEYRGAGKVVNPTRELIRLLGDDDVSVSEIISYASVSYDERVRRYDLLESFKDVRAPLEPRTSLGASINKAGLILMVA
jgi:hypothetical protein